MSDGSHDQAAPKRCEMCGADLEPTSSVDDGARRLGFDMWAMMSDPRHGYAENARKMYVMLARVYGRHTTRQIAQTIGCTAMSVSKIAGQIAAEYPEASSVIKGSLRRVKR